MEKHRYIYNHKGVPSDKYFLVAIPVYMHTIQTNRFTDGLNFFQRSVLKFMEKPGISTKTIAGFLKIPENLVKYIQKELKNKNCIDEYNSVSEDGKLYLNQSKGLMIDTSNTQYGHIFQFCDQNDFYPFYINKFNVCDYDEEAKRIFIETNNESTPTISKAIFSIDVNRKDLPLPSEQQALKLMENRRDLDTYHEGSNAGVYIDDDAYEGMSFHDMMRKEELLNIRFLSKDTPELVYLCTFIYKEKIENEVYEDDWKVLDPFIEEFNPGLTFYIKSLRNESLDEEIKKRFKDVPTVSEKNVIEADRFVKKSVNTIMDNEIGVIPSIRCDEDKDFERYVKNALEESLLCGIKKNDNDKHKEDMVLSTQKMIEQVLMIDSRERKALYKTIDEKWFLNSHNKPKDLSGSDGSDFRCHIKSSLQYHMQHRANNREKSYSNLLNVSQKFNNKDGLFKSIYKLLLCWEEDGNSQLIRLFEKHLDFILENSKYRNNGAHAKRKRYGSALHINENEYRNFIIEFTKDYINI